MFDRCYPLNGKFKVTSPFGKRDAFATTKGASSANHLGIDLVVTGGNIDDTIVSASVGTVTRTGYQNYFGNYAWVSNDDGTGCMYCHLATIYVSKGQKVGCKDAIGKMGETGNVSGKHLDFKTSRNSNYSTSWTKPESYFYDPAIFLGMPVNGANTNGKVFDGDIGITGSTVVYSSSETNVYGNSGSSNSSSAVSIQPSGEYYKVVDLKGVTKDWLYGRKYRVLIDLGNDEALDVSNLRCEFEIQKTLYNKIQTSTLTIYNLSAENENRIIESGQRIIIEAGYVGEFYGKIFEGNIVQPLRYKENGTDYKLTLVSMDSDRYVSQAIIGISEVAKQSRRDVVKDIAQKASIVSDTGTLLENNFTYQRGKVMFGKASDYLEQIAKSEKAKYYHEDGKINIVDAGTIQDGYIFSLSPKTGLINSPVQEQFGVNCSCLLNPMIQLNSLFHLDNTRIKGMQYTYGQAVRPLDSEGIYRVIEIKYIGDTRGNDWKCDIFAISQAGQLPDMMLSEQVLIW